MEEFTVFYRLTSRENPGQKREQEVTIHGFSDDMDGTREEAKAAIEELVDLTRWTYEITRIALIDC